MKSLVFFILFSPLSYGQTKIAIIDSGYDTGFVIRENKIPLKLCKSGHFDFLTKAPRVGSAFPHGTIVGSVIAKELRRVDYCALIYQVSLSMFDGTTDQATMIKAIRMATKQDVSAINISMSGSGFSDGEFQALKAASDKGIKIFVAAGNDMQRFTAEHCSVFPACYNVTNLITVAGVDHTGKLCDTSNYGYKTVRAVGELVWLYRDEDGREVRDHRCATSFATPRALSSYVLRHQLRPTISPKKPLPTQPKPSTPMKDGTK